MPAEKFDKNYVYNIRHSYAKEGKRTDYTPYSCMKVIASQPGPSEAHGCPFKTFDEDNLRAALQQMGLVPAALKDAIQKAKARHYQLACGVTFEGTHGGCSCEAGIQHPNQYVQESRKCLEPDRQLNAETAHATAALAKGMPQTPHASSVSKSNIVTPPT